MKFRYGGRIVFLLTAVLAACASLAQAETGDSATFTAFYPSPGGVYKTIVMHPTGAPPASQKDAGLMYYNQTDHILYYNNSQRWVPLTETVITDHISEGSLSRGQWVTLNSAGRALVTPNIPSGRLIQSVVIMFSGESCPCPRDNWKWYRGGFNWVDYKITISAHRRSFLLEYKRKDSSLPYRPVSSTVATDEGCGPAFSSGYGVFYTVHYR